jgi:iron(III) transport system substrate-binding protein
MQLNGCINLHIGRKMKLTRKAPVIAFALAALLLSGCASETASQPSETTAAAQDSLVLYSGRSEDLIAPLLAKFTAETGIAVTARYGASAEMAAAILEEGDNVKADVFLSQDAGALGSLTGQVDVKALPSDLLAQVSPAYQAKDGTWIGVSGRARVLAYNPELVTTLPTSVFDLTDPGWKGRIGIAPTNASFQAFVTGMRVIKGDQATGDFLAALKTNAVFYEGNSQILAAIEAGEVAAGLINHYYWFEKAAEVGRENMKSKTAWFAPGDPGNLVNVAGVSVLSENAAAITFARWLLSETAQQYFLETTFEYSLTTDVAPDASLPKLSEIGGPEIDLSNLSSLNVTLEMLAKAGLI